MDIAAEKYVSLTTYRKDGREVSTPVWIASLDGGKVGFTTAGDAGKVKRIRNNPAVTLRPCDMKGRTKPDAPVVKGTAAIVTGAGHDDVWKAVRSKYGFSAALIGAWGKITDVFKKGSTVADSAIVITLD